MHLTRAPLYLLLTALLALVGCSAPSYNAATAFPYQIDKQTLADQKIKRIVIATSNFSGEPTRYHLQKAAARIDVRVKNYLQQNGFEIAPASLSRIEAGPWGARVLSLHETAGMDA